MFGGFRVDSCWEHWQKHRLEAGARSIGIGISIGKARSFEAGARSIGIGIGTSVGIGS